jgi:hypothetical protein
VSAESIVTTPDICASDASGEVADVPVPVPDCVPDPEPEPLPDPCPGSVVVPRPKPWPGVNEPGSWICVSEACELERPRSAMKPTAVPLPKERSSARAEAPAMRPVRRPRRMRFGGTGTPMASTVSGRPKASVAGAGQGCPAGWPPAGIAVA